MPTYFGDIAKTAKGARSFGARASLRAHHPT